MKQPGGIGPYLGDQGGHITPKSFAKVQADYALLEAGIDPESDFVMGMQAQGKVPAAAQAFAQVQNASFAEGNKMKALDTQASNLVTGIVADDTQSGDAAAANEVISPPSGIRSEASAEYTDSEVALDNVPSGGDAKPASAAQELSKAGSFLELQNEATPMSDQDPESDLAMYSEVYQNGLTFDL